MQNPEEKEPLKPYALLPDNESNKRLSDDEYRFEVAQTLYNSTKYSSTEQKETKCDIDENYSMQTRVFNNNSKTYDNPSFTITFSTEFRVGSKDKLKMFGYGEELSYGFSKKVTSITFGVDLKDGIYVMEKLFLGQDAYRKPISFYLDILKNPTTFEKYEGGASFGRGIGAFGVAFNQDKQVYAEGGVSPGTVWNYYFTDKEINRDNVVLDWGETKLIGFNIRITVSDPDTDSSMTNEEWVEKARKNVEEFGSITK